MADNIERREWNPDKGDSSYHVNKAREIEKSKTEQERAADEKWWAEIEKGAQYIDEPDEDTPDKPSSAE